MTAKTPVRVKGHSLRDEGYPYDQDAQKRWSDSSEGCALCECGWLSAVLPSTAARRRAHRDHKEREWQAQHGGNPEEMAERIASHRHGGRGRLGWDNARKSATSLIYTIREMGGTVTLPPAAGTRR